MTDSASGMDPLLNEVNQPFLLWLIVVITLLALLVISVTVILTVIGCQVYWRKRRHIRFYTTDSSSKQPVQRLNSVYSVKSQENIVKSTGSLRSSTLRISTHNEDSGSNHAEPSQTIVTNEQPQGDEEDHLYDKVNSTSAPTLHSNARSVEEGIVVVPQNDTMTTTATDFEQSQLAEVNLAAFPISPSEFVSPLPQDENTSEAKPHFTFEDGTLMTHYLATVDPEIRGEDAVVGLNIQQPPTIYSSQILQTVSSDKEIELQDIASGQVHGTELDIDDFADEYIIESELSVPIVIIQTPAAMSDDHDRFIMLSPCQSSPPERFGGNNPITSGVDSMKTNRERFVNCDSENVNNQDIQQQHDPEATYDRLPASSGLMQQQQGDDDEDNLYDQPIFSRQDKRKVVDPSTLFDDPGYSKGISRSKRASLQDPTLFIDHGTAATGTSKSLDLLFDDPGYTRGMLLAKDDFEETGGDHQPRGRSMTLDLQSVDLQSVAQQQQTRREPRQQIRRKGAKRYVNVPPGGFKRKQKARADLHEELHDEEVLGEVKLKQESRQQIRRKGVKSASYENVPPGGFKRMPKKQNARVDLHEELDEAEVAIGEMKLKQNLSVQGATTIPFLKGSINSLDLLDYQEQELEELDPDVAACLHEDFDSSNELEVTQV